MIAFAGIGGVCWLIGWIWTLVVAFQKKDIVWGVVGIFCGIVAIIYAAMHMAELKVPLILMIIGIVLSGIGQASLLGR